LEQRKAQLEEAYTFVANVTDKALSGVPPYRATRVRREIDGSLVAMESWPSLGLCFSGDGDSEHSTIGGVLDAEVPGAATNATHMPSLLGRYVTWQ